MNHRMKVWRDEHSKYKHAIEILLFLLKKKHKQNCYLSYSLKEAIILNAFNILNEQLF